MTRGLGLRVRGPGCPRCGCDCSSVGRSRRGRCCGLRFGLRFARERGGCGIPGGFSSSERSEVSLMGVTYETEVFRSVQDGGLDLDF